MKVIGYLLMKVMIVKEVMTGDVSPVAMLSLTLPGIPQLIDEAAVLLSRFMNEEPAGREAQSVTKSRHQQGPARLRPIMLR